MIRVLFICHGNICRSPMAEFILKHLVRERGCEEDFLIASAATSTEEIWNGRGVRFIRRHGRNWRSTGSTAEGNEPCRSRKATTTNMII